MSKEKQPEHHMPVAYLVTTKDGTHYFWTGRDSAILALGGKSDNDYREQNELLADSVVEKSGWRDACETNPIDGGFVRTDPASVIIQLVNRRSGGGIMAKLMSNSSRLQVSHKGDGMEDFIKNRFACDLKRAEVELDEAAISTIVLSSLK